MQIPYFMYKSYFYKNKIENRRDKMNLELKNGIWNCVKLKIGEKQKN